MNKLTIAAQTIKETVSALDVGQAMGLEIRHGRCKCPIHVGQDYNCVLYSGNRGFYCHRCKSGGDIIQFVQQSQGMDFRTAINWINDTFHLGLDLDGRIDEDKRRQAEMAQILRKNAIEQQEMKDRMSFGVMLMADRIVERLEDIRDRNVPRTPNERWNDAFCDAIRSLPEAREFADDCMMDCIKEEK